MKTVSTFNNILIFNPAFLGDAVLSTPLIKAVKKLYPSALITFTTRPEYAELFTDIDIIDTVLPFDKYGKYKGFFGTLRFAKILREKKFDLIINLHRYTRSTFLLKLAKPKFLLGFKSASFSFLFDGSVYRDKLLHEVQRNLSTLEPLVEDYTLASVIELGGKVITRFDRSLFSKIKLYQSTISPNKKLIGLAIGSVWKTKRYPPEQFAELATLLYLSNYTIVLFGSSADKKSYDEFIKYYKYPYIDYLYKIDIKDLSTFIASVDILISNDSGPVHIASSTITTIIDIFGATVPQQGFSPYTDNSYIVENLDLTCRPCGAHGGNKCPKKHFKCMNDIDYNEIKAIIDKIGE